MKAHSRVICLNLSIAAALWCAAPASGAPGDLDPSFGEHGIAHATFGEGRGVSATIAIQPDGRVVTAGTFTPGDPYTDDHPSVFAVARHAADGDLDRSFSGDGKVTTGFSGPEGTQLSARAHDAALDGDGRVVVVGSAGEALALARYLPEGELDPSFGVAGRVTTEVSGSVAVGSTVSLLEDGRILVAGLVDSKLAVARYLVDGSLDPSFAGDGLVVSNVTSRGSSYGDSASIAVDPAGRILVAGDTADADSAIALLRYLPNGEIDAAFGTDGVVVARPDSLVSDMELLADGRILVSGITLAGGRQQIMVTRFSPDGAIDESFSDAAMRRRPFRRLLVSSTELAVASDGRLVLAVEALSLVTVRLHPAGDVDRSFLGDGKTSTPIGNQVPVDVAIQSDGRVLALKRFRLVRHLVGPGPADADADGLRDRRDRCPEVWAGTTHGCPVEKVTKLYDVEFELGRKGDFWGWIAATSPACDSGVFARLYERRRGRDRVVGRGYTGSSSTQGYFHVSGRIGPGVYYVRVAGEVRDESVRCRAFRSRNLRLR